MSLHVDKLADGASIPGLVLLNFGDPAYRINSDTTSGLSRAESIFLRISAYLLFSDAVSVPSRYMLDGPEYAEAAAWAAPLLREGILVPERRTGPTSFQELARVRRLPEASFRRAEFLDENASRIRSFKHDQLSSRYTELLTNDLRPNGAFRRTIPGALRGRIVPAMDQALADFIENADGSPESFVKSVSKASSTNRVAALRWAMARYYITPIMFDSANIREIPSSAAGLLARGGVLDRALVPFESAAPVEYAADRLSALHANLPAVSPRKYHREYCEALLEVRRELPEARTLFRHINDKYYMREAGESLSQMFISELAKQTKSRPSRDRIYTFVSSLIGAAAGYAVSTSISGSPAIDIAAALATGTVLAGVSNEVQHDISDYVKKTKQPWVLAIDKLEKKIDGLA